MRCRTTLFQRAIKEGGYTLQKATNGSGFATCDKWLGGKNLLSAAQKLFWFSLSQGEVMQRWGRMSYYLPCEI